MQRLQSSHKLASIVTAAGMGICITGSGADIKIKAYNADSQKGEAGVIVRLKRCGGNVSDAKQRTTDEDGKCMFSELTEGDYCLRFDQTGYTLIVPSARRVLAAGESAVEEVRAYRDNQIINPEKVVAFLRTRSNGNPLRYERDVNALRVGGNLPPQTLKAIAATGTAQTIGWKVCSGTGEIASISPAADYILIYRREAGGRLRKYHYSKRTRIVDLEGKTVDWSALKPFSRVRYTYIKEGNRNVVTKLVLASPISATPTPIP
jgi:hypothetical protein